MLGVAFLRSIIREIELTRGKVAIVDDDMFDELNRHKWYAAWIDGHWYAMRIGPRPKRHKISMARTIMDAQPGELVDHRDNEATLDNRRSNLRICTASQNAANSKKRANCSSKYKGVYWHKPSGKWLVQIGIHGKRIHLGYFDNEDDAGRAYNRAAIEQWGEFARTSMNKIDK